MNADAENQKNKYAVVEFNGRQFRVEEGDVLTIDRVAGDVGSTIEFGRPLLLEEDSNIKIGRPAVDGAKVTATVLGHERGSKVLIFKFKKVKNYRRKRGHRQELSRVRIDSISL